MKSHFQLSKLVSSLIVVGGVSFVGSQAMAAVTPMAGTNISNVATATYTDSTGTERVVTSNEVKTIVAQVGSFTLETNRTAQTTPNGQVTLPHILTNTGNGTDKFTVSLDNLSGDDFNFADGKYAVYLDRNKDGVPDDSANLNGNVVELKAGESVGLVVVATTPSTVSAGDFANLNLIVSVTNADLYKGSDDKDLIKEPTESTVLPYKFNTDKVIITSGAVIQITKAASVSTAKIGDTITYTLTFKNTGNAVAKKVAIFDVLPDTVEFIADSARFNGSSTVLTDAEDKTDTFASNGKAILFNIESIEPNTTGKLTFSVKVKDSTNVGNIQNTAFVDPNGNDEDPDDPKFLELKDLPENPNEKPTDPDAVPSNPSIVTVVGTYNSALNDSSTINTLTGKDDKITLAGQQGLPVIFGGSKADDGDKVVVHNNGNSVDTYNLTYNKDGLPTGSIVEILKIDGNTPVVDTNGDGIVDTGPIEPGKNQEFVVRVTLPNGTVLTEPATVVLTSTSINGEKASDMMNLIISSLTENKVDLVSKVGGVEQGEKNSSDTTYITPYSDKVVDQKITPPGTPTVFDITVYNKGNLSDNYNVTVPDVPIGWIVDIFEKVNGECSSTKVTNTGNIKVNESKSFCVKVTPPAGTPANSFDDITVQVTSPSSKTTDDINFRVYIAEQRQLTLTPDRQGQVAPGGTIVYSHTLTNTGNVMEGTSFTREYKDEKGNTKTETVDYPLNIEWTDPASGWNTSIYVDLNDNGILESNELIVGSSFVGMGNKDQDGKQQPDQVSLAPNTSVKVFVKVESPAHATPGQSDTTTVTIKSTDTKTHPLFEKIMPEKPKDVSITDLTTITVGQVRLVKEQAVKNCTTFDAIIYSNNITTVKPGQCVFYRITATNEGNALVNNVIISDMVPAYTSLFANPTDVQSWASVFPVVNDESFKENVEVNDRKVSYTIDYLNPGSTATLHFSVKVDKTEATPENPETP